MVYSLFTCARNWTDKGVYTILIFFLPRSGFVQQYIQHSYAFYKEARQKLRDLYVELENRDVDCIVFYGASDLAEIAYISLQETNIKLVAVVDEQKNGQRFMRYTVEHPDRLKAFAFDKILITSFNSAELIMQKIADLGIPVESVVQLS